ncbi:hypothetical protein ACN08X_04790 [Rothia sp. P6271]|uniref:hypothetical protein n=1 Tax=unclassified Rothia (in: high G+C Gram-positive bacteria) TaxID=2689056 RepID=UPI003ACC7402
MPQIIHVEPHSSHDSDSQNNTQEEYQGSELSIDISRIRKEVLAVEGVEKIYPHYAGATRILRAMSAVNSTVGSTVRETLNGSASSEQKKGIDSDRSRSSQSAVQTPQLNIVLRLGTTSSANVPDTVRTVAQVVRRIVEEPVVLHIDVVNS